MRQIEKAVLLQTLDHLWREHLVTLDHLRQVIGLRGYGQRDPLNEYKTESFTLFEQMLARLREAVTGQLMHVELAQQEAPPLDAAELSAHGGASFRSDHRRGRVRAEAASAGAGTARRRARPRAARRPCGNGRRTRRSRRPGARCSGTRSAPAARARNTSTATAQYS